MTFLTAASVLTGAWFRQGQSNTVLVMIGLLLALSCISVAIRPGTELEFASLTSTRRALLVAALTLAVLAIGY